MTAHLPRRREKRCEHLATVVKPSIKAWVQEMARQAGVTTSQWLFDQLVATRRRQMVARNLRNLRANLAERENA